MTICLLPPGSRAWVFERANVSSTGVQGIGNGGDSSLSWNGRFVAFRCGDDNLVPGVTTGLYQVYVKDRATGALECVSLGPGGILPNGEGSLPSISWDGRYVAFASSATNLCPVDGTNSMTNVFVFDRLAKTLENININAAGQPGNGTATGPSLSGDGRYVAFTSSATNLSNPAPAFAGQVYIRDRWNGTVEIVSVNDAGAPANEGGSGVVISGDGQWVAYGSTSGNLVPGISGPTPQVYLFNRVTRTVRCLSVNASGVQGNYTCGAPAINANGSIVVFTTGADNLVPGDVTPSPYTDVLLFDNFMGGLTLISKDVFGVQVPLHSAWADRFIVSADGSRVIYALPSGRQIYMLNRNDNTRWIVSLGVDGNPAVGNNLMSSISPDGNCFLFLSGGTNLLVPDNNGGNQDIYVTCLTPPVWPTDTPTATLTPTPLATVTFTPTPSVTMSPSPTITLGTPTPGCHEGRPDPPVVYPNPSKGRVVVRVRANACWDVDYVKIKLVTTAYRVLNEIELGPQVVGVVDTEIELRDRRGKNIANGLYYVLVETQRDRSVGKVMVVN